MAGDQRHAVAGHLVGDRHRLLRVAGVVADIEIELLAEHAAGGVDVLDGQLARRSSSVDRRRHTDP